MPLSASDAGDFWGTSAVGALARDHDWSASPLGDPAGWPQPLRTLTGVMLGAAQPMFTAWGPTRAMLYNDSYAALIGRKHPGALGRPFFDVWPEIVADVTPIMDRAYAGQPTQMNDIMLLLERGGYPEESHFNFSYTPVRGAEGRVDGMFCCLTETTAQVLAERRREFLLGLGDALRKLDEPLEAMMLAARLLGGQLRASVVGYCETDATLDYVDIVGTWGAEGATPVTGRHRLDDYGPAMIQELKAGRAVVIEDTGRDALTAGQDASAHDRIGVLGLMNLPLVKEGRLVGVLFAHSARPRAWSAQDVALAEDVAERTWAAVQRARAERALRQNEERYRLIVESAREYAIIMLDTRGVITGWNLGAERILGHTETDALGHAHALFFTPEDVAAGTPEAELLRARTQGRATNERWHVRRDGTRFWGSGLLMPLADVARGGFVSIFRDMTEERAARGERERLVLALQAERARLRAVFETVPVGLIVAEAPGGRILDGNSRVETILRHKLLPSPDVASYREWVSFHADGTPVAAHEYPLARAVRGQEERPELEAIYRRGDDTQAWMRFVAAPIRDNTERVVGGVVAVLDIDREKRAIAELEASRDSQRLLIDELNHRVKNTLATVQSLAQQSLRSAETPAAFAVAFAARLRALAAAHDLLTREAWEGATLGDVAQAALGPWIAEGRVLLDGPAVRLAPKQALALSMALGELTTNAAKHGALADAAGRVALRWTFDGEVRAEWREVAGPPVLPPERRGLGSRLLGKPLASELGGTLELLFEPEGVRCLLAFPLAPRADAVPGPA